MHIHRTPDQIAADRQRYIAFQRDGMEAKTLPQPSPRPAPIAENYRLSETLPGDWYTTLHVKKGEVLRLAPGGDGSTVSLAAWALADTSERLCLPDTVKLQWTTDLTKGRVVFSDMGRVMLSLVEDSSGAHDVLTGGSTPESVAGHDSGRRRNTRDNMVLAAAKIGLGRRDIPPVLNLFAPVRVDAHGRFTWRAAMLAAGDWVDLRAEMDLFIALSNCRHPLDPLSGKAPPDLSVTCLTARPVSDDDLCRTATAEAQRGFENNARLQGAQ
ncbi:urea amidolyase associated protein UAAP1 [Paracoccus sp. Ld10]|uniref:urea amidolyase associated protein UAAP1 n=1 Tax=Paracoccus sp. Ld10 TaxID=649158 RepID=UPI003864EE02